MVKSIAYILLVLFSIPLNILEAQNIPIRYRKTVAFLSSKTNLGTHNNLGTGFFMIAVDSTYPFMYLVTARHVILEKEKPYINLTISYNKLNKLRDSVTLRLSDRGNSRNVFYHKDSSVDIAVIPLPLFAIKDSSDISFSGIAELFKSKTDFDTSYINPGTNLFYTGMFSPYMGYQQNYPITRFGKVALITNEKIQFDKGEPKANLVLAETTTFGGNSGSPVFAYGSDYKITSNDKSDRINSKEQNHVPIYMLGVMKGYFQQDAPVAFVNTSTMTPIYSTNIGIAAVIPSYFLYEIIEGTDLKLFRKSIISREK